MAVAGLKIEIGYFLLASNEEFTTNELGELLVYVFAGLEDWQAWLFVYTAFTETFTGRFDVNTTPFCPASLGANLGARMESKSGGTWVYREAVGG